MQSSESSYDNIQERNKALRHLHSVVLQQPGWRIEPKSERDKENPKQKQEKKNPTNPQNQNHKATI